MSLAGAASLVLTLVSVAMTLFVGFDEARQKAAGKPANPAVAANAGQRPAGNHPQAPAEPLAVVEGRREVLQARAQLDGDLRALAQELVALDRIAKHAAIRPDNLAAHERLQQAATSVGR